MMGNFHEISLQSEIILKYFGILCSYVVADPPGVARVKKKVDIETDVTIF